MVKNHLKTISVPRTWPVKRKEKIWITKPNSGSHSIASALPLNVILKDILNIAKSTKEVRFILQNKEILVDQIQRKDVKFGVGLMDTLSLIKNHYRMLFDQYGKMNFVEIPETEAKIKPSKILNKTCVKGKFQLNLSDGRNILVDKNEYKIGDSLLLELPSQKILKILPLQKDAYIFLVGGKHLGDHGKVEEVTNQHIVFKSNKKLVKTLKKYAIVIGKEKSEITLMRQK